MNERQRLFVLMAATVGASLIGFNSAMVFVALAPIVSHFQVSMSVATWLVLLYLIAMTSLQPAAGKLGDIYGYRRIFLGGMVLFGAASFGAALAPSFPLLVLFRSLQGIAGATLAPNAIALIRLSYPLDRQGFAMGLYSSVFSVGSTAGPMVGGFLIYFFSWQAVFWVNVPAVLFSVWLGLRVLPAGHEQRQTRLDWLGTSVFAAFITTVVFAAMLWKEDMLPVPLWVPALLAAGLGWLFYWIEERTADPLFRLNLFALPGFGAANAAAFFMHTMLNGLTVAVPMYLQAGRGLTPTTAGIYLATYSLLQIIVSPFAGRLSDHLGRRRLAMLGALAFGAGLVLLLGLRPGSPLSLVLTAQVLFGIGVGLGTPPIQAACVTACPPALIGVGSGVWYSSRYLGNVSGVALTGLLLPESLSGGAFVLFAVLLGAAGLMAATSWFLLDHAAASTSSRGR